MERGGVSAGALLERAAEFDAIASAIEAVQAGSGSALLVEGAAGLGKTRLLRYACELGAGAGMTVLAARAAEFENGFVWGVVRQLFEACTDRERAARHAREATRAASRLITLTSTAMPEAMVALLWADHSDEAWAVAQEYLRLAQERGRPLVSAIAAAATAVIAYHDGDVQQALAYAQQAMTAGGDNWISAIAVAFIVHALIDRGAIAQARTVLTGHGMTAAIAGQAGAGPRAARSRDCPPQGRRP
jgi:hypothetical protein